MSVFVFKVKHRSNMFGNEKNIICYSWLLLLFMFAMQGEKKLALCCLCRE